MMIEMIFLLILLLSSQTLLQTFSQGIPTRVPTRAPTRAPTRTPTIPLPSRLPTNSPTRLPTRFPTKSPTRAPTPSSTLFACDVDRSNSCCLNNKYVILTSTSGSISAYRFKDCTNFETVIVGSTITNVGDGAFDSCFNLGTVTLNDAVTVVGEGAFNNCQSLETVSLSSKMTALSNNLFKNCSSLQSITILTSIQTIGDYVFQLSGLVTLTIPNSVISIGTGLCNSCSSLGSASIPSSVSSLGTSSFQNCYSLSTVTFSGQTSIPAETFSNCSSLTSIIFDTALVSIGNSAFIYCSGLTSFSFTSITTIGDYSFQGTGLTNITLPFSLTSVGDASFSSNYYLNTAYVYHSTIAQSQFQNNIALGSLYLGDTVTTIRQNAFTNTLLTCIYYNSAITRVIANSALPTLISCGPTSLPSSRPSSQPTNPSSRPSSQPSSQPSNPSSQPSSQPTNPSSQPSSHPSVTPTSAPSLFCNIGFYLENTGTCTRCADGFMSTFVRAKTCDACAAGSFSDFNNFKCSPCAAGYFSSTDGSNICSACPIGTYSDIIGSTSCTVCKSGTTTALTATINPDACQSPTTSFGMGLVGLFVAIALVAVNILGSRSSLTAFVRRIRIVDPIANTCKKLMGSLDSIKRAMSIQKVKFMKEEEAAALCLPNHLRTLRNLGKVVVMVTVMALMTMIIMMIFFGHYLLRIFYHTFVLWRGLRFDFSLNANFADIMNSVLKQLSVVIDVPYISALLLVFYPITKLLEALATFHLDLNTVNVSCSGSQAPLELTINVVILGLFTIFIKSNYQALIAVPISEILRSALEVVVFYNSRIIMGWSLLRWLFSLIYLVTVQVLLSMRPLLSALQYLMSFTSVQSFFPFHNYTSTCNNIQNFNGIDAALAGMSTFLVYILIAPVIYTISTVMVPGMPYDSNFFGNITRNGLFDREHFYFARYESPNPTSKSDEHCTVKYLYRSYRILKLLISPDVMFMFLVAFQNVRIIVSQAEEILLLESIIEGLNDSSLRYPSDRIVLDNIITIKSGESQKPPSSPKGDEFSGKYDSVVNIDTKISIKSADDGFIKVNNNDDDYDNNDFAHDDFDDDIFSYNKLSRSLSRTNNKSWIVMSATLAKSKVEEIATLTSFCVDELKAREVEDLKKKRMTSDRFPSYYTLSRWTYQELLVTLDLDDEVIIEKDTDGPIEVSVAEGVAINNPDSEVTNTDDFNDNNNAISIKNHWFAKLKLSLSRALLFALSFTIMGHLLTQTGRSAYTIIFWKAYIMAKVSIGVWNDDWMHAFDTDETFAEMLITDTDERNMGDYLEAIVGLRSVLFQLVPGLTIVSVYVQNTSKTPIYITNQKLLKCVPEFLLTYSQARELAIEVELRRIGEHHDQIHNYKEFNIQEWTIVLLTLHLFVTRSRLIEYCLGALSVAASISVVFGTASSDLDKSETTGFLKKLLIVILVVYVPYSFFLALKYLVIFGKVFHLRDSDFWFDFMSVWIWIKQICCCQSNTSNALDLIKLVWILLNPEVDRNSEGDDDDEISEETAVGCGLERENDENRDTEIIDISSNVELDSNGDIEETIYERVDFINDNELLERDNDLNIEEDVAVDSSSKLEIVEEPRDDSEWNENVVNDISRHSSEDIHYDNSPRLYASFDLDDIESIHIDDVLSVSDDDDSPVKLASEAHHIDTKNGNNVTSSQSDDNHSPGNTVDEIEQVLMSGLGSLSTVGNAIESDCRQYTTDDS